ncbi:MAG: hypothetical protein SGI77_00025 [Pirellulaceae bacterium]|nr:hypothetical protein [Pirellulaceae bacterium]
MKRVSKLSAVTLCVLGMGTTSFAQDILESYYGRGVHAYFAGNGQRAEELLSDVITAGSKDARAYYFRGLSQVLTKGGMTEAGKADFEQAAQLEISGKHSADISKALTRIQGPTRMAIEQIRAKARLAAKVNQVGMPRSGSNQSDPNMGNLVDPQKTDPFGGNSGLTEGDPKPMPTPESVPAVDAPSIFDTTPTPEATMPAPTPGAADPFSDDPAPGATTPAVDPFAT